MKYTLIILFLSLILESSAQNQGNVWYFGYGAGIDFNAGTPTAITDGQTGFQSGSQLPSLEGISVISDDSGSLLFYTEGLNVWNRNHQIMPNGINLMGHWSSTQSAIIVPAPIDPDRYFYIFTVGVGQAYYISSKASYSVVDICLEDGYGDVLSNEKNIILGDSLPEKLAVTRHANGEDYWILTHKHFTNNFWAFLLTANGITDTVVSSVGSVYPYSWTSSVGQMKFSPNGQRIILGTFKDLNNHVELFDFNISTGIVSNPIDVYLPNNDYTYIYGTEFSPDNSKLYLSGRSSTSEHFSELVQYDLSNNIPSSINSSMYILYYDTTFYPEVGGMQLGPDGKIYVTQHPQYLSVINNPNNAGSSCNFQISTINLDGKICAYSLPGFIAGYDYSNTSSNCDLGTQKLSLEERKLLKVVDLMGRETAGRSNILQIYIYSDGSTEKIFNVE